MSSQMPLWTAHSESGRLQSLTCEEHVHETLSITSPSQQDRWLLPPLSPWHMKQCWGWVIGFHTEERQIYPHNGNQSAGLLLSLCERFRLHLHTTRCMRIHQKDTFQKISQASLLCFCSGKNPSLFVRHCAKWLKYIILSHYKMLKERHCCLSSTD